MEKEIERLLELTPDELAARWRLSVATLATWRSRKWRRLGKGIAFNKRGRSITYSMADILEYERKNRMEIGSENSC